MEPRMSLYREIHKGIRLMALDLVVGAGRTDFEDAAQVEALRASVRSVFALLSGHAETETRFMDPLYETHVPALGEELGADHARQEEQLDALLLMLDSAPAQAGPEGAGQAFVVALSRFVGEMLVHMADEEEKGMRLLWESATDAEILETHRAIIASIPPEKMAAYARFMFPAMNLPERVAMLIGVRMTAPPQVYAFLRGLAAETLTPAEDAELEQAIREATETAA